MLQSKEAELERRAFEFIERRWKLLVLLTWLVFAGWWIYASWSNIRWFALGDTDDNMRIMQVRALLHGQGWFDLRQYRMNPPFGANIHWSRLVDLPIAGLILTLRPFIGGAPAERWAVAIAPILPYLLLLFSLSLTARRLLGRAAYPFALLTLIFAASTNSMFAPERIDHHGWQLALLALSISSIADTNRARGGLVLGISTALSLAIGLEMIIYLALAGAAMVLFWVDDVAERERLRSYALSLGISSILCFLIFASYANRAPVCDALSPVWLSDLVLSSCLMYSLARYSPAQWRVRLALAFGAGVIIGGFHALAWPDCLQRPEHISPEVQRLWMSHVKEARPVYLHGWRVALLMVSLPITGAIGWVAMMWRSRGDRDLLRRIIAAAVPGFAASLLLLWQTRTGPAAQMLAVVGGAAIVWYLIPIFWKSTNSVLLVLGAACVVLLGAGAVVPLVLRFIPEPPSSARDNAIGKANRLCSSMWGLRPIALQPKGVVMTYVDLGPRLITLTHHDAIAGPYHRNGQQIADVMNFWRGSAEQAHRLAAKYHVNYVLSCPDSSTTTIFTSETPQGFYVQLQRGQVPQWLKRVTLPKDSPFEMWRVVG
jgi:hypothetical protein